MKQKKESENLKKIKINVLCWLGILVYLVAALVNRFVYIIPDNIYIPIIIFAALLFISGIFRRRRRR